MFGFLGNVALGFVQEKNIMAKEERQANAAAVTRINELADAKTLAEFEQGLKTDAAVKQWEEESKANDLDSRRRAFAGADKTVQQIILKNSTPEWREEILGSGVLSSDSEMANLIVDIDNTTPMGSETLPFSIDFSKKDEVLAGVGTFEAYLKRNKSEVDRLLQEDEDYREDFEVYASNLYTRYNNVFYGEYSGTGEDGTVTSPAYADYKQRAPTFRNYLLDFGIVSSRQFNNTPEDAAEDEVVIMIPNRDEDPMQPDYTASTIKLNAVTDELGVSTNSLDALATHHQMPNGGRQVFANMDYMSYADDPESGIVAIGHGAKLVGTGATDLLKLEGAASKVVLNNAADAFSQIGGGSFEKNYADEDVGAMVRAAYTIIKPNPIEEGMPTISKKAVSGVQYALDQKFDVGGFREQRAAQEESVILLSWLQNNQQQLGVTGFSQQLLRVGVGLAAQGQQLYELFIGPDAERENVEFTSNLDEDTTTNMLMNTARAALGKGTDEVLSEIDALKITLAAKLARAVDPSGRLSNQDFEMQLKRIGQEGLLTSMDGSLAAIEVVKTEMNQRIKEGELLNSIISKETIEPKDRRFIKAHKMVQKALVHRNRRNRMQTPVAETEGEAQPKVSINPGDFRDIQGATIDDRPVAIRVEGDGPQYIFTDDNTPVAADAEFDSLKKGQN